MAVGKAVSVGKDADEDESAVDLERS